MTVEHVPTSGVMPARDVSLPADRELDMTTDGGASIVSPVAAAPVASKDAAHKNVHCSGYNVWA